MPNPFVVFRIQMQRPIAASGCEAHAQKRETPARQVVIFSVHGVIEHGLNIRDLPAQLEFLGNPKTHHPFYWASFVSAGAPTVVH